MATIVVSAQNVIESANKFIREVMAEREARDEKNILKVMNKPRGWFKKYYPTREQAIQILDNSDDWGWKSQYAWGDLNKAKSLLKLAQHGNPITLSEDEARFLF